MPFAYISTNARICVKDSTPLDEKKKLVGARGIELRHYVCVHCCTGDKCNSPAPQLKSGIMMLSWVCCSSTDTLKKALKQNEPGKKWIYRCASFMLTWLQNLTCILCRKRFFILFKGCNSFDEHLMLTPSFHMDLSRLCLFWSRADSSNATRKKWHQAMWKWMLCFHGSVTIMPEAFVLHVL